MSNPIATLIRVAQNEEYPFPRCLAEAMGQVVEVVDISDMDSGIVWVESPCGNAHPVLMDCLKLNEDFRSASLNRLRRAQIEKYLSQFRSDWRQQLIDGYDLAGRRKETIDMIVDIVQREVNDAVYGVADLGGFSYRNVCQMLNSAGIPGLTHTIDNLYDKINHAATCVAKSVHVEDAGKTLQQALLAADIMETEAKLIRQAVHDATVKAMESSMEMTLRVEVTAYGDPFVPIPWPEKGKRIAASAHFVRPKGEANKNLWRHAPYYFGHNKDRIYVSNAAVANWDLGRRLTPEEEKLWQAMEINTPREPACQHQTLQTKTPE
jgi:hypothetical protein